MGLAGLARDDGDGGDELTDRGWIGLSRLRFCGTCLVASSRGR